MAFLFQDQNQGTRNDQPRGNSGLSRPFSFIRTLTVGFGIAPNLLTLFPKGGKKALAGLGLVHPYRRWGLSPRPENIGRPVERPVYNYGECRLRQQGLPHGESACPPACFGRPEAMPGRRSGPKKIND
jgi:hypothetical protein